MAKIAGEYIIYTDGACSGNPGPGGWAAVIAEDGRKQEIWGREEDTTNQRMELKAAVEGLKRVPAGSRVKLYSDSAYLVNCFRQGWIERWQKNGWRTSSKEPVANRELWLELLEASEGLEVEWIKVKGHSDNSGNNRADELAREAISGQGNGHNTLNLEKGLAKEDDSPCLSFGGNAGDTEKTRPDDQDGAERQGELFTDHTANVNFGKRRIGLLTGGGDCPGLNAVIRAVVKGATYNFDTEVIGFDNGFRGLVENEARIIDDLSVSGILNRGGTILGTSNRDNPFDYRPESGDYRETGVDRSADAVRHLEKWGIENLVVIGGDGSLLLAHRFSELGVPIIGIPKTIDNDLPATDVTFGFDSAVTTATEAIDKIHTTAESHHRVMVVEVMGRNAGWIALQAGMAGGGDIILIPELPFEYTNLAEKIEERRSRGKKFSIIVVAEGAYPVGGEPVYQAAGRIKRLGGIGVEVSEEVEKMTGMESRATVLGHLQRGGSPTSYDRVLATRFGVKAVELFQSRSYNNMVCLQGSKIKHVPLKDAVAGTKKVDPESEQVRAAIAVGTSFGCPVYSFAEHVGLKQND